MNFLVFFFGTSYLPTPKILTWGVAARGEPDSGNPHARSGLWEVEFSPMEEVLHEEVLF